MIWLDSKIKLNMSILCLSKKCLQKPEETDYDLSIQYL